MQYPLLLPLTFPSGKIFFRHGWPECLNEGLTTSSPYSAYEKPTPMGWSTKKMFAFVFHECAKGLVPLASEILHGPDDVVRGVFIENQDVDLPNSMKRPREEEHPGPS